MLFLSSINNISDNSKQVLNFQTFKPSNFQTMFATDRIQEQYDSSIKSFKGKIMSGAKERATKRYFKDAAARARRKQGKTSFDTFRRDDQPDAEDLRLEDIHFANFLGVKDTVGVPYNQNYINEPVNICECDMLRPEPETETTSQVGSEESDNDSLIDVGQIEKETNSVWNMNWDYDIESITLTGYNTFKRGHGDDVDEQYAKRMRSEFDALSRMEEGLLTNEMQQEENNFAEMVAYMKQQLALVQQIMEDELYSCDCCR